MEWRQPRRPAGERAGRGVAPLRFGPPSLGILHPERFEADTRIWQVQSGQASLVLYSDGLIKAGNPDGEPFGEARLLTALGQRGDRHESVMAAVRHHLGGERGHDDISLVCVDCLAH